MLHKGAGVLLRRRRFEAPVGPQASQHFMLAGAMIAKTTPWEGLDSGSDLRAIHNYQPRGLTGSGSNHALIQVNQVNATTLRHASQRAQEPNLREEPTRRKMGTGRGARMLHDKGHPRTRTSNTKGQGGPHQRIA